MRNCRLLVPVYTVFLPFLLFNACSSDRSSTMVSQGLSVGKGALRIDDHNRYFVFDDGSPYIPIGLNKFLFMEDDSTIDSLMRKWSANGINYLRVWVGLGADPEIKIGRFSEEKMHTLDYIIMCGEKYDVYLNICFWNDNCIREQDGEWGWNGSEQIYNKAHSDLGTTTDANDLKDTLHTPSWEAMKNRFAYFIDRWKDEPAIIMWDLVNDSKKTDAWKNGMYDFVKRRDGSGRIVTFQYNTGRDPNGEMDYGSVRVYNYNPAGNDPEEMMLSLAERIRQALKHGEPVLCGEGRMDYENASEYALERGFLHFLWAPIAVGAAGNLHSWISIRSSKDRWPDLSEKELGWIKCYSDFCKKIDWSEFNSKNVDEEVKVDHADVRAFACRSEMELIVYIMNNDTTNTFSEIQTQLNISSHFQPGQYEMKWIDIRTGKEIATARITEFPTQLDLPSFRDGLFGHLQKI